jgi:tetratricopeptide (TPR) repeat protein
MKKAQSLDPLSPSVNTGLARIYQFRKEYDQALVQIDKTILLDTLYADAYFVKGKVYSKMHQPELAIKEFRKAVSLSNRRPIILAALGSAYGRLGKTAEARKLLAELEQPPVNNDKLYAAGLIKSSLGQTDAALNILEKLAKEKYGVMVYMQVEKEVTLKSDSTRYRRLLKEIRLE